MLDVVIMIGFDRVMLGGSIASPESSSSGEVPAESPVGGDAFGRCKIDADFDAIFANAAARSG